MCQKFILTPAFLVVARPLTPDEERQRFFEMRRVKEILHGVRRNFKYFL